MPKAIPPERQMAELAILNAHPASVEAKLALPRLLKSKHGIVAAKAAKLMVDGAHSDCLPNLITEFSRFFSDGTDKGCLAKNAFSNALYTLGCNQADPFLRGIHHIQLEPSFGTSVDAAAEMRGWCALGLARMGYPDVLLELAELLMDKEFQPRVMAVRAIAYTGSTEGAPLLRMKAVAGDAEPEVTAECFIGLMKLSPRKSMPFVARFLKSNDPAIVEAAGLAIGGSRTPEAFELLHAEWESHLQPQPRRPLLLSIAMTRLPQAIDFLLERVLDDRPKPAGDAIAAMVLYKHDETIRSKLQQIIAERGESDLQAALKKTFG